MHPSDSSNEENTERHAPAIPAYSAVHNNSTLALVPRLQLGASWPPCPPPPPPAPASLSAGPDTRCTPRAGDTGAPCCAWCRNALTVATATALVKSSVLNVAPPATGCDGRIPADTPCLTAASTLSSTGLKPAGACAYETRRGIGCGRTGDGGAIVIDGAPCVCEAVAACETGVTLRSTRAPLALW
jgi:hypothetical protein